MENKQGYIIYLYVEVSLILRLKDKHGIKHNKVCSYWKNNQQQGGVIWRSVKRSYSYRPEVDYFPVISCPGVFYSYF